MKVFELITKVKDFLLETANHFETNKLWLCGQDGMHPYWKSELENDDAAAIYLVKCFIDWLAHDNMDENFNHLDTAVLECLSTHSFGSIVSIHIENTTGNKIWIYK